MVVVKPTTKLTYQDYAKTPEGEIWELIDGEKFMPPSPSEAHQGVNMELAWLLHGFVKTRSLGRVYFAPFDVVLSDLDVVQPDLLFVSNERSDIVTAANVRGAPDLVVEIRSPSTAKVDQARPVCRRQGVLGGGPGRTYNLRRPPRPGELASAYTVAARRAAGGTNISSNRARTIRSLHARALR